MKKNFILLFLLIFVGCYKSERTDFEKVNSAMALLKSRWQAFSNIGSLDCMEVQELLYFLKCEVVYLGICLQEDKIELTIEPSEAENMKFVEAKKLSSLKLLLKLNNESKLSPLSENRSLGARQNE